MIRLQPFFSTIELSTSHLNIGKIKIITKNELRNKSGIYGFLCKSNNKLYIGYSVQLSDRLSRHLNGTKSNVLLQISINKYGLEYFIFIIFEYCKPEELISLEQFYINELKPEYNILKIAGSSLGFSHSEESKALMSKIKSGENHPNYGKTLYSETKALMSQAMISLNRTGKNHPYYGKTHFSETKTLMSLTRLGKNNSMFGRTHSAESKAKMGAIQGNIIFVYNSDGSLANTFTLIRKAKKYFNCSPSTIQRYVYTNQLFQDKWILYFTTKK